MRDQICAGAAHVWRVGFEPLGDLSSLAASLASDAASHWRRSPFSYQTALQRPCSSRAGYTVIPHSNSMTSPLPRVVARPVPLAMTQLRAVRLPFFGRPTLLAGPLWRSCGVSVGILVRTGAACAMGIPSLPALSQVRGLAM